jgi:hypothetical protein
MKEEKDGSEQGRKRDKRRTCMEVEMSDNNLGVQWNNKDKVSEQRYRETR